MKKVKKNRNKKLIIISSIIILIILVIVSLIINNIWYNKNKLELYLIDSLEVEINSEIYLNSFVKNIKNGKIINSDDLIDTSILGKKELKLLIETKKDTIEYKFEINVIDTIKPKITAKDEITTYVGNAIDLLENVEVNDNSYEYIEIEIIGDYDINKVGKYNLKYVAKDSSNNEVSYDFILNVIENPNYKTFTTSKGYLAKVIDGVTYIDGILIVNKTYKLPSTYGNGLTDNTKNAFNKMKNDALSEGLNLYISSGYRSYQTQSTIYNNYVKNDGQQKADTYSARAGHSEHQTGLAFDLNTIDSSFANTKEGIWVNNNAYKYGLIIRYPKDKDNITGYMYEPWHLRYVGVELATILYNNGNWLTLEEYYGIDSKYDN